MGPSPFCWGPCCIGIDSGKGGKLSKRELRVAERAAQGQSNKQIADELKLSEHTIKNYLVRVFEKLDISSRFELLFLLFNERHQSPPINRAAEFEVAGLNHPIETYLKAAEEAFIAAQYLVGLAHLRGSGVEKDGRTAYYWLRMAEESSQELKQRTRALTQELKSAMTAGEVEKLEHSVAAGVQRKKLLTTKDSSTFLEAKRRLDCA
ncbi:MAG TPA: LuxR C-terminal-related transcriptional regulator [Terriglobales bacterium]|nr:LuxR C-terminal-related transcriptional regulator [Terriglobales bacterium]